MIWALPAVVAFVATVAILFATRRVVGDAAELTETIVRFREFRQPVLELRAEALALKADVLELRARPAGARPIEPPAS
jgi:hypothetical protein